MHLFTFNTALVMQCWMWKSACVGVHQLLDWKRHGETLKIDRIRLPDYFFLN